MAVASAEVRFEQVTEYRALIGGRPGVVRFVDVPACRQFAVDGTGQPGGPAFQTAFGALYPTAYTLHFALKRRGVAAPIGALEGLFWLGDDGPIQADTFLSSGGDPERWHWCLGLPIPEQAEPGEIATAIDDVGRKQNPPALTRLEVVTWTEGPSAQILHMGPYSTEGPTIARLHEAITSAGLRPHGRHHEIYISDPNRTAPDRLKTVIRQPVEPATLDTVARGGSLPRSSERPRGRPARRRTERAARPPCRRARVLGPVT